MSKRPTATDAHSGLTQAAMGKVKVALPAWVQSYDRDDQRATIQIAIRYRVGDTYRARPASVNVPVQWLGVTWDLEAGEWGIALICDRSLDEWKQAGAQDTQPQDGRRWDITDAVFLPGVRPFADALPSDAVANGAVVVWDRGTGDLRLGSSSATDYVALESLVSAQLTLLANAFTAWVPVPNDGGAALKTLLTALIGLGWPGNMAATKVKAE